MTVHVVGCSTGTTPGHDQVWRFNVDYTKVSDPSYFNDFEFRYLSQAGAGLMELDYLPSDKVYKDEHP